MSEGETERPERKEKTAPNGDKILEADDCRFISSPSGTVHERGEWPGETHDYDYHPRCGQRLPADSMWGHVGAESPEEAVLKYDLKPCGRCFTQSSRLDRWRKAIHGNFAYSSADNVPDEVLRKASLERYIETNGGSA